MKGKVMQALKEGWYGKAALGAERGAEISSDQDI